MKLKIFLTAQALFFLAFGLYLYANRAKYINEFYLETIPVDPRDLISGTYVDLRLSIEEEVKNCIKEKGIEGHFSGYFKFSPSDKKIKVKEVSQDITPFKVSDCVSETDYKKEKSGESYWAKIIFYTYKNDIYVTLPNHFYLNEKDERKNLNFKESIVQVIIARDKTLQIKNLLTIK